MEKKTILVAEDSPTMRMYITFALKKVPNVKVIEVGDGVQALKKLNEEKIDLVLLDINMPLMSGFEALSQMRKTPKLEKIPVVMCTTEDDSREKGMELGANAYLSKPVKQGDLLKALKEHLGI